ncbi:hypothetical protein KC19_2G004700 [Ceratodon purpureus]|uniref:Uncharacterized protein n=1 Tax=Ceratodon purpureus TaxID=3225 RepID=A0A8T0IQ92_CERPU|nr:hypothetical protein KC19_2G004700 [Ceratodon purpureus]
MAAKFEVNLVKNSTASSTHCRQARTKTAKAPPWARSLSALFNAPRITRKIATTRPDRQAVPNDGPNATLNARFVAFKVEEPAWAKYH